MKRLALLACMAGVPLTVAGCEAAAGVAGTIVRDQVTVTLRNTSDDFDVDVRLYFHDDDDVFEDILTNIGQQRDFVLPPGQSATFTEDCDDLQAIIIDDADLLVIAVGQIGPETNTPVLRDGDDFRCNDTLVFTFSHTDALVDFDVAYDTE